MHQFIVRFFTSLRLTVTLLALAVLLVFFGTLSQVDEGLWKAQKIWFESYIVTWQHLQLFGLRFVVPIFPGGYLIGFTLLVEKMLRFQQSSASFRTTAMGPAAQIYGIVFNSIKTNTDIEVPKMRMQLRLNQFKTQKRGCAPAAKICTTQIRDAMIVRRAVTLGLPVFLVGTEGNEEDSVANDYMKLATEIIENAPPA